MEVAKILVMRRHCDNITPNSDDMERRPNERLSSITGIREEQMIKKSCALVTLLLVFCCIGCAMPMRTPVMGGIYTGVQAGESATGVAAPQKRGEACAMSILGLVAIGDASVEAAAKNGGISEISVVDNDMTGILGVYGQHCTVVHGN